MEIDKQQVIELLRNKGKNKNEHYTLDQLDELLAGM